MSHPWVSKLSRIDLTRKDQPQEPHIGSLASGRKEEIIQIDNNTVHSVSVLPSSSPSYWKFLLVYLIKSRKGRLAVLNIGNFSYTVCWRNVCRRNVCRQSVLSTKYFVDEMFSTKCCRQKVVDKVSVDNNLSTNDINTNELDPILFKANNKVTRYFHK